jgi:hypothetical protein
LRIRLDENISYKVADAIKAFLSNRSGGLIVDWVGDDNPPGTADPTWIKKYAEDGGIAFISGDANIRKNPVDLIAYIESGLIGFWVPPGYDDLRGYGQAALLLRWFPTIVEKIKSCSRGECWQIPLNWGSDINGLKLLRDPRLNPAVSVARLPGTIHQFRRGG